MQLNKLSLKNKLEIQLILLLLLIIGGGWFVYVLPMRQIEAIKNEITSSDKKIAARISTTKNIKSLREEYQQKQQLLPLMQKVLPSEVQTTKFLGQILHSAVGLDIDFLSIGKPEIVRGQNPEDVLQKISLALSLRGGFPDFINYLDKLRRIQRLFNISKMQVRLEDDIAPEVKVDLTIETYRR